MISKKNYFIIILAFSSVFLNAQILFDNAFEQNKIYYFIPEEIAKIDFNNTNDGVLYLKSNKTTFKTYNGWYPKKGELYFGSETEIAGYLYFEISEEGLLDKEISVCNNQYLYDSTVIVMNRTQYTKGKDLYDTVYNYLKNPDGTYVLDLRTTYSYHYFDHFEGDSLFYEQIMHNWDDVNKEWINYHRIKFGYHDTLVQFNNRIEEYWAGPNNEWELYAYSYDSITYNDKGFVDSLFRSHNLGDGYKHTFKAGFINDELGRYTQVNLFYKQNDIWISGGAYYDVTWTEWNGFMYGNERALGGETLSPYKRTKINSYYINNIAFYQKIWDINTLSNYDVQYQIIDGEKYIVDTFEHYYNEYDDYVEWRNTAYKLPDENGEQKLEAWNSIYNDYTYDEIYGKTGYMRYLIGLNDGSLDSTFYNGEKYTEFAYFESIQEYSQKTIQPLIIAPNPASGIVNISTQEEIIQLNIFSITGKLVNKQYPVSNQVTFDVGILPKGIYNVQAIFESGNLQTGKLVVE